MFIAAVSALLGSFRRAKQHGAIGSTVALVLCGASMTTDASETGPASRLKASTARATDCAQPVVVFEAGRILGSLCPEQAQRQGYTLVDLSADWVPRIFAAGVDNQPAYAEVYRALADQRSRTATGRRVRPERYLELFGVFSTLRVLREQVLNESRHRCHRSIDNAPLAEYSGAMRAVSASQWSKRRQDARDWARLRDQMQVPKISTVEPHQRRVDRQRRLARRWQRLRRSVGAVEVVQAHLRCDGLLAKRGVSGVFDWRTARALEQWQRRQMIIGNGILDEESREAMLLDSRELVFRAVLRSLRERIVDATGLIEDGSAQGRPGRVLGRDLSPAPLRLASSQLPALSNAAPDLIAAATEIAARSLGWHDPKAVAAAFSGTKSAAYSRWVALRLPPRPAWHSAHMDLRAEVDRGELWYAFSRRRRRQRLRPTVRLYVNHQGRRIGLARWNTTIGGWKAEVSPEGLRGMRYKESPSGPRLWRDIVAAPVWLPPTTAPDEELLKRRRSGSRPNYELFGPGYRSAYGLVLIRHHRVYPDAANRRPPREQRIVDEGVRIHGSVSYRSILRGYSHGCHRLFNHLAVRLGGFLLQHRHHLVRGPDRAGFRRQLAHQDSSALIKLNSRGFRYELTPPVPVQVLRGKIRGRRQHAIRGMRFTPKQRAAIRGAKSTASSVKAADEAKTAVNQPLAG